MNGILRHAANNNNTYDACNHHQDDDHHDDDDDNFDAASALLDRGALLRKLREMEVQDEQERKQQQQQQQQQQSLSGSSSTSTNAVSVSAGAVQDNPDTLDYNQYLSIQGYHDDYKHVNYPFIDFGVVLNQEEEEADDDEFEQRAMLRRTTTTTTTNGNRIDSCLSLKSLESTTSSSNDSNVTMASTTSTTISTSTSTTLSSNNNNNNNNNNTFVVAQDRGVGKGGLIWDAGFILGEHVLQYSQDWSRTGGVGSSSSSSSYSKSTPTSSSTTTTTTTTTIPIPITSMVELGAGTGITGFYVAKSFPTTTHVHLTDLPELQPLLETNRRLTNTMQNTTTCVLPWGSGASKRMHATSTTTATTSAASSNCHLMTPAKSTTTSTTATTATKTTSTFDVILGADVAASIYDSSALMETIYDLAHEHTWVYISGRDRLTGTVEGLQVQLQTLFRFVEQVPVQSRNQNPTVSILRATGKKVSKQ
jgi:hypothetical protein